jgi:hypothetical protein
VSFGGVVVVCVLDFFCLCLADLELFVVGGQCVAPTWSNILSSPQRMGLGPGTGTGTGTQTLFCQQTRFTKGLYKRSCRTLDTSVGPILKGAPEVRSYKCVYKRGSPDTMYPFFYERACTART